VLNEVVSVRNCRELARHVSRPVVECPIAILGNNCECLKLQDTQIARDVKTLCINIITAVAEESYLYDHLSCQ